MNFTFDELCQSNTAQQFGIKNIPDSITVMDNMLNLICECLQPLRNKLARPIIINSGFRSKELNAKVGGVNNSQHLTGQAVDIHVNGMSTESLVSFIRKSNVRFTQLIEEHSGGTSWVHIGYDKKNLKGEVLRYKNGVYVRI